MIVTNARVRLVDGRNDHLQAYLDEFAFRFNRRRTPMAALQTLLGLASGIHGPTTYDLLYRSESTR